MGMPVIPDQGNIDITRDEAINLVLASIGSEEVALAHILNAEGEKIQEAVHKWHHCKIDVEDLLDVNESIRETLIVAIKKEMLLEFKLENVMRLIQLQKRRPKPCKKEF